MEGQMSIFDYIPKDHEHNVTEKCGTCDYFVHYVCGLGGIYHGTACAVNAPFARDVDAADDACDKWRKRE